MNDKYYMQQAIELANQAAKQGEVPVGAVIVDIRTGKVVAEAYNAVEEDRDATAHAELLVIKRAAKFLMGTQGEVSRPGEPSASEAEPGGKKEQRLSSFDIYVTLEPCAMCAGAIAHARIRRLVFGAYDPKSGGVEHGPKVFSHSTTHHKPEIIGGVEERTCADLLTGFFQDLR